MGRFMQHLLRGVIIAGVVFVLLGAWDPTFVLWAFRIGVIVFILAGLYGLLGGKEPGLPLIVGLGLMFEGVLVNAARTELRIVSIVIAVVALIWLVRTRRRTQPRQQNHTPRQNPANWAGDSN